MAWANAGSELLQAALTAEARASSRESKTRACSVWASERTPTLRLSALVQRRRQRKRQRDHKHGVVPCRERVLGLKPKSLYQPCEEARRRSYPAHIEPLARARHRHKEQVLLLL